MHAGRSLHLVPSLPELHVDSGDSAELQCVLVGNPIHGGSFTWTGPAVGNNEDGRTALTVSASGALSTLTISDFGSDDAGQYTCSYMDVGTVSIMLTVVGKLL